MREHAPQPVVAIRCQGEEEKRKSRVNRVGGVSVSACRGSGIVTRQGGRRTRIKRITGMNFAYRPARGLDDGEKQSRETESSSSIIREA
jgi:hypothetical protein